LLRNLLTDLTKGSAKNSIGYKRHAFNVALDQVDPQTRRENEEKNDALTIAKKSLFEFFEYFLDDYKLKVFKAVFLEPSKVYYRAIDRIDHAIFADVHAANVYAAILLATLGVQLPVLPYFDDDEDWGRVSFLRVAARNLQYRNALRALWSLDNLGKSSEKLAECSNFDIPNEERELEGSFFLPGRIPREIANSALDESLGSKPLRQELAQYLNVFMDFFKSHIVVEKALNMINQSMSSELQLIFDDFRVKDANIPAELTDYRFWIWDVNSGEFRIDRACKLLDLIGVLDYNPDLDDKMDKERKFPFDHFVPVETTDEGV